MLNYRKLETEMSLQMRGEVAMANNKAWMCKLWYFASASDPFVVELSPCVLPLVFAPTEKLNLPRTLYVLCRGITARKGMPLSFGAFARGLKDAHAVFTLDEAERVYALYVGAAAAAAREPLHYADFAARFGDADLLRPTLAGASSSAYRRNQFFF